jgi:hypothetical protein
MTRVYINEKCLNLSGDLCYSPYRMERYQDMIVSLKLRNSKKEYINHHLKIKHMTVARTP